MILKSDFQQEILECSQLIGQMGDKAYEYSVFISGFPPKSNVKKIEEFIINDCKLHQFKLRLGKSNKFSGYCFLFFKSMKEAENFTMKPLVFEGKTLNSKVSMDQESYIINKLEEARSPCKIFVDSIPKYLDKEKLNTILLKYGAIEILEYVNKEEKPINIAYVTFKDTKSAKNCVETKIVYSDRDVNIFAYYSKPNFTKHMLIKLHPVLKQYLVDVRKGKVQYNPSKLARIYDKLVDKGEHIYDSSGPGSAKEENMYELKCINLVDQMKNLTLNECDNTPQNHQDYQMVNNFKQKKHIDDKQDAKSLKNQTAYSKKDVKSFKGNMKFKKPLNSFQDSHAYYDYNRSFNNMHPNQMPFYGCQQDMYGYYSYQDPNQSQGYSPHDQVNYSNPLPPNRNSQIGYLPQHESNHDGSLPPDQNSQINYLPEDYTYYDNNQILDYKNDQRAPVINDTGSDNFYYNNNYYVENNTPGSLQNSYNNYHQADFNQPDREYEQIGNYMPPNQEHYYNDNQYYQSEGQGTYSNQTTEKSEQIQDYNECYYDNKT